MMREFSFDQRKFQEFVHHALRCGHDASEVGIGHLLYDIDADAYDPSGKAHDFSRGMKARSLHHRAGPFPHHAGILS
jgi:hypothetical protein